MTIFVLLTENIREELKSQGVVDHIMKFQGCAKVSSLGTGGSACKCGMW